jgi:hypothetical protein
VVNPAPAEHALRRPSVPAGSADRNLTVASSAGLCNRLRVLTSGLVLAEAAGRSFRMYWPSNIRCAAPFASLFANRWNVTDGAEAALARMPPHDDWRYGRLPDLLEDPTPHLTLEYNDWLLKPAHFEGHARLQPRVVERFSQLEPVAGLRKRVERFASEHFRPLMIGVHLRRGDMLRFRPDVTANTRLALAQVEAFLAASPEAGVLLCTDDGAADPWTREVREEGVARAFEERFGSRLVRTQPRSLDRAEAAAIEDALVDLWLLRKTDMLVGSQGSTFSHLAAFGRDVPVVFHGAPLESYRRFERWCKLTGIYYVVDLIARRRYRDRVPFPRAWSLFSRRLPRHLRSPGQSPR